MIDTIKIISDKDYIYLVYNNGIIRCDINKDNPNVCFISNLFVDINYRKQGLGLKLIKQAETFAKNNNCNIVSLFCKKDSWLKNWYNKLGYNYIIDWDNEFILMTKNI